MKSSRSLEMDVSRKAIQKSYKKFGMRHSINPELSAQIYPLLNKRVNERGIRSLFTRLVFQYIKKQAQKEGIQLHDFREVVFNEQLPLVAETIIAIQYYENQILDQKGGIRNNNNELSKAKIDQNLIASHIIKDDLYEYIDREILPENLEHARMVTECARKIFKSVDLGQLFQDNYGTLTVWEKGLEQYQSISPEIDQSIDYSVINLFWLEINKSGTFNTYEWFVRNYLKRIYLTSASLFVEMARLVMDLLGYTAERGAKEYHNILHFSAMHGMLGQIVNDNNDFALPKYSLSTISKTPEDAFADLRNNNITLPVMLYLAENPLNAKLLTKIITRLNKQPSELSLVLDRIGNAFHIPIFRKDRYIDNLHKSIVEKITPGLEQSMKISQKLADMIDLRDLIKCSEIGNILIDMNSVAKIAHNKFYQVMTQPAFYDAMSAEQSKAYSSSDTNTAEHPGASLEKASTNSHQKIPLSALPGRQLERKAIFQSKYSKKSIRLSPIKSGFHFA